MKAEKYVIFARNKNLFIYFCGMLFSKSLDFKYRLKMWIILKSEEIKHFADPTQNGNWC